MALFSYKTGVWPISLEIAGARLSLNQDGSVQLQLGATEIGQGADTVFSQMVAETLQTDMAHVHIQTVQDTDVSPFDTGAYASRQSFVTGTAVKHCAEILRDKILAYAKTLLPEVDTREVPAILPSRILIRTSLPPDMILASGCSFRSITASDTVFAL